MATVQTRRTKDGKLRFRVMVRLKGHPPEYATFSRKTDAKRWAQQTEADIREGRYFQSREAKRHTLGQAIERYVRGVAVEPNYGAIEIRKREQYLGW